MRKRILALALALAVAALFSGCHKEGPAERAGKKMDEMMEKAKEKLDRATQ